MEAIINLDVLDMASFFHREHVIGELRTCVRFGQMMEQRAKEIQDYLKSEEAQQGEDEP